MLFAVSESNNSIRKEISRPADGRRLHPDHHPAYKDSRKSNIDNQELILEFNFGKPTPEELSGKRYTGRYALDCIVNHKCTMKLYPLDMLLAVGGSDNLIGQRTNPERAKERLSINSSGTL